MSEGVEWSIHSCTVLAFLDEDQALPAARLAEYHGVPATYLTKHLQALVRAGICESRPGPHGGYRLAVAAAEISLLDITLAVDGDATAFQCSEIRQRGPVAAGADPSSYRGPCGIAAAMWRAEDAWRRELAAVSLADVLETLGRTVPHERLVESAVWLTDAVTVRGSKRRPNRKERSS